MFLSSLDFTNEIIDFWPILWLFNTRVTQIIGLILILAFFLIHYGMLREMELYKLPHFKNSCLEKKILKTGFTVPSGVY